MDNLKRCTNPLKLSKDQENYLQASNYTVDLECGAKFQRKLTVVGLEPFSGNILIKETYSGLYKYQKLLVISACGREEKFKGQKFLNV